MTRWRTLLGVHLALSAAAFVIVLPVGLLVDGLLGSRPDGALELWRHGGAVAADLVTRNLTGLLAAARTAGVLAAFFVLISPVATAVLIDAHLGGRDVAPARVAELARLYWSRLVVQRIAHLLAVGCAAAAGLALSSLADSATVDWASAPAQWALRIIAFLPAVALAVAFSAALDVAQGMVVGGSAGAVRTFVAAARATVRRPVGTVGPYLLTLLAAGLVTGAGAWIASALGGRPGALGLLLLAAHQAIALTRTLLRAAWLGKAADLGTALTAPAPAPYADGSLPIPE